MKVYQTKMSYIEVKTIYNNCIHERRTYHIDGDSPESSYNSFASNLENDETLYKRVYNIILEHDPSIKKLRFERAGVNLYLPNTRMTYHTDSTSPSTTVLLYTNPITKPEDGGETKFIVNDEIISVLPKPGRLLIFDGRMKHTATSFLTIPRVTVYFKFFGLSETFAPVV